MSRPWCSPVIEHSLSARFHVPRPRIGAFGFSDTNQAVAVRVDLGELFIRAEEFTPGHIAIAVAIHLAEPDRAFCCLLNLALRSRHGHPLGIGVGRRPALADV